MIKEQVGENNIMDREKYMITTKIKKETNQF